MSIRDVLLDVRPLRQSDDFRRLWIGSTLSAVGGQLTTFAVTFQVWETTRSAASVGVIGLAVALPVIVFALLGGTAADAMDRRRLAILTTTGQLGVAALLAAQAFLESRSLWLVLLLVSLNSACGAVGAPARRTFVPRLLSPDRLAAGLALTGLSFQAGMLLGPALAGVVTTAWGVGVCFALDTLTFAVALWCIARLPAMPPEGRGSRPGGRDVLAGLALAAREPMVRGAFLVDISATVLAMPVALFPVINAERFGGSPATLGLFTTALSVGGVVASALSGPVTRARRPGAVMLGAAAVWGLSIAGVGLLPHFGGVLACLAVAGAVDTIAVTTRGTVVQLATPDSHRGRVSAVEYIVGVAGPDLGNARAGLVAASFSATVGLVSGGALCVAGIALVAVCTPTLTAELVSPRSPRRAGRGSRGRR